MKALNNLFEKLTVMVMVLYIKFVYRTSKIIYSGQKNLLSDEEGEKYVYLFWHGQSYCLYPVLKGVKLYVATTKDRRGDYITDICHSFGYKTIRLPDVSDHGNYIFKINDMVNHQDIAHIAISMDGPLGPYHEPKDFPLAVAYLLKRKVVPIQINMKRKLTAKKRWDKYEFPLPFNRITIIISEPLGIAREDKQELFSSLKDNIKSQVI